jgi:superfamily I DNA/RNA helicase
MNLKDIKTSVSFDELWVIPLLDTASPHGTPQSSVPQNGIGRLKATINPAEYNFIIGSECIPIKLRDANLAGDLNFHLKRGCAHLAQALQKAKDDSIMLKIVFFTGELIEMGEVDVGIDSRIVETAKKHEQFNTPDDLAKILKDKCAISDGKNVWFLMKTGVASENDFSSDEDSNPAAQNPRAFSISGARLTIPVERRRLDATTESFFATKIVYKDMRSDDSSPSLARGNLLFSDNAKRIQALASGSLCRLDEQGDSYLVAWDKYGDEEGKILLQKAKAIGKITYTNVEKSGNGVKFFLSETIPESLSEDDQLELTREAPPYLENPDLTWEQYSAMLEERYKTKAEKNDETQDVEQNEKEQYRDKSFLVTRIADTSIELADLDPPPMGMFLVLSINGEKAQIERRMKARLAIKEGRSANPLLGLVIEEGGILPDIQRVTKIKPITPFVSEKIFKHSPTVRQVEAIDAGLNTPDIALIQGPPGTGKTTVVTAILERLNEEYDKKNSIRGKILVSGFQHDAVENIIARLSVNSLPAIKFGRRSGEKESAETVTTKKLDQWRDDIIEKIHAKNPHIMQTEHMRKLQELFRQYSLTPSRNTAKILLAYILDLPRTILDEDTLGRASDIRDMLEEESVAGDKTIIDVIRALRTEEKSFTDDGCERALALLITLKDKLNNHEQAFLNRAVRWKEGNDLSFLDELTQMQDELLARYIPRPMFSVEKPRTDITDLIMRVNELLKSQQNEGNKRDKILAEFLNELENNPDGIQESIEDYNFVYAATTQGAEGSDIRRAKTEMLKYDTVIIDEAARASPRDLLIPMAQAEKRIILVGDHRQLPHIVDDEVVRRALNNEEEGATVNADFRRFIEHSMFEYLKKRLRDLDRLDREKGIYVTRVVTLDEQYRMHPLLGNFVNQYFYAPYEGEGFNSPLPVEHFTHHLPGTDGKAALWLHVNHKQGEMERAGTSWRRWAEAEAIAKQLKIWLDSDAGKTLSFGVISFYKAQSNLIFEALGKPAISITERTSSAEPWKIREEYAFLKKMENGKEKIEERLRIGTVDAFQGMEFDVVFLSMVRSPKNIPQLSSNENNEKIKAQTFGHLMSENRLCVSVSRQKRALVLVGDGDLARSPIAKKAVPAIAAFHELCAGGEGKIL